MEMFKALRFLAMCAWIFGVCTCTAEAIENLFFHFFLCALQCSMLYVGGGCQDECTLMVGPDTIGGAGSRAVGIATHCVWYGTDLTLLY